MLLYPLYFVFPFAMAYAAVTDLLTMRISNRVSLGLCLAFFAMAPIAGIGGQQMLAHLGVGAAMLAFGMTLFALRLFGGGDTKLFAVAALWIGFDQLALFIAYVTIFGGGLAILLLAYRSVPAGAFPLPAWAARLHHRDEGMPYGVAIAAGALTIFPQTAWSTLLAG